MLIITGILSSLEELIRKKEQWLQGNGTASIIERKLLLTLLPFER